MSTELEKLETVLQRYKNNYDFAVKNNNPIRQTKYKNLISGIERKIKDIEKDQPLESNTRLREIIDDQNKKIKRLGEANNKLETELKAMNKKIDNFVNPPKPEEPKPDDDQLECPKCGRTIKGKSAMTTHQRYHCKAAH